MIQFFLRILVVVGLLKDRIIGFIQFYQDAGSLILSGFGSYWSFKGIWMLVLNSS
jgi:hypothetical protein